MVVGADGRCTIKKQSLIGKIYYWMIFENDHDDDHDDDHDIIMAGL